MKKPLDYGWNHPNPENNWFNSEALRPQRIGKHPHFDVRVVWKTDGHEEYSDMNAAIVQSRFHMFCSRNRRDALRFTLRAAYEVAKVPLKSRTSFRPEGLSITPDGSIVGEQIETLPRKVLYINTLCAQWMLENEWVGMFPEVEQWIADPRGEMHPFTDLPMEVLSMQADVLVKYFDRLVQRIRQEKIATLVINSFEFATSTERYKRELILRLKELNEKMGVTVLLATSVPQLRVETRSTGPYADLRYLSSCVATIPESALESLPNGALISDGLASADPFGAATDLSSAILSVAERNGTPIPDEARRILEGPRRPNDNEPDDLESPGESFVYIE